MVKKGIEHGFSIANIAIIILLGLIVWGIFYGAKIAPQVRSTANQIANLNKYQNTNIHCDIHPLSRTLDCTIKALGSL
jgi:hypothetical protein